MFTSIAGVFRTRQAVRDLFEVVQSHSDAVYRLGATGTDRSEIVGITEAGCVIADTGTRAYSSILLAAAMPDEDFNAFIAATAILLADRLQDGGGVDDLYWNYEAFRDHYKLSDPPVRAAIMNGYRTAGMLARVKLPDPPLPEVCLTRLKDDVLQLLAANGHDQLHDIITGDPTPEIAGVLWNSASKETLTFPEQAAYRFLYERPSSIEPPDPEHAALLPQV